MNEQYVTIFMIGGYIIIIIALFHKDILDFIKKLTG
jgi:hypothetical protein